MSIVDNAQGSDNSLTIRWDDRDMFWIGSTATAADIREVLAFLKAYDGT
jgi:hypothetical protein